ncbi:MAG: MFS transporter [Pseudomonadota bacterium]
MRMLISFAALILSVVLLQLSSGGVGPLDALSGLALGFTRAQVGLLGSAHFLGFFIGCWWAPRLMGRIGHSRAFAAFTAAGAIGLLAHMLIIDPYAWAGMRIASGLCIAGCYTVIESWLQAKVTNETRGRAMGAYRAADMGASLAAQLIIAVLEPASYVSYNLLALLCCASLLPLTLTTATPPKTSDAPRLRPSIAWAKSPLAVAGVIVAGLTGAAFRFVGPIYGQEVGLRTDQIAWFLAAFVLGGALAQIPTGWLADKFDRRKVLIWLSVAAIACSVLTAAAAPLGTLAIFATAALFGFATFPVYSVAAAHAHDFATTDERVELSAALLFFFALGAIASPIVASNLIEAYGPPALFVFIGAGHLALIAYSLIRMAARPSAADRTPYIYAPRTSFLIGRLTKRLRDPDRDS